MNSIEIIENELIDIQILTSSGLTPKQLMGIIYNKRVKLICWGLHPATIDQIAGPADEMLYQGAPDEEIFKFIFNAAQAHRKLK